jgi:hypothetical protein
MQEVKSRPGRLCPSPPATGDGSSIGASRVAGLCGRVNLRDESLDVFPSIQAISVDWVAVGTNLALPPPIP